MSQRILDKQRKEAARKFYTIIDGVPIPARVSGVSSKGLSNAEISEITERLEKIISKSR